MAAINFKAVNSVQALRKELTVVSALPDYAWIKPVLDESTNDYVTRHLPAATAKHRYAPWRVEETQRRPPRSVDGRVRRPGTPPGQKRFAGADRAAVFAGVGQSHRDAQV